MHRGTGASVTAGDRGRIMPVSARWPRKPRSPDQSARPDVHHARPAYSPRNQTDELSLSKPFKHPGGELTQRMREKCSQMNRLTQAARQFLRVLCE